MTNLSWGPVSNLTQGVSLTFETIFLGTWIYFLGRALWQSLWGFVMRHHLWNMSTKVRNNEPQYRAHLISPLDRSKYSQQTMTLTLTRLHLRCTLSERRKGALSCSRTSAETWIGQLRVSWRIRGSWTKRTRPAIRMPLMRELLTLLSGSTSREMVSTYLSGSCWKNPKFYFRGASLWCDPGDRKLKRRFWGQQRLWSCPTSEV